MKKSKKQCYSDLDKKIKVLLETKRVLTQQIAVLQVDKIKIKNEILRDIRQEENLRKKFENMKECKDRMMYI